MASNEQIDALRQDVPADAVSQREGAGGRSNDYVKGAWVIEELNLIFGNGNWGHSIEILTRLGCEKRQEGGFVAGAECIVKLEVEGCKPQDGVGHGVGYDRLSFLAIESASKEAETDALKRAAKNLGRRLGLSLYLGGKAASRPSEGTDYTPGRSNGGEHRRPPSTSGRSSQTHGDGDKITFGKHKGKLWADIPDDYLDWLFSNGRDDAKRRATAELERRGASSQRESEGQPQDDGPPPPDDDDIPF